MEMTLDESLAEVDKWKHAAVDQLASLPTHERAKVSRDAVAWLEREISRALERGPTVEHESATDT